MSDAHHSPAEHATEDPVEAITSVVPVVLPVAGAVLIFLLAFIANFMA